MVVVQRQRIPAPGQASGGERYLYSVTLFYRYRAGQAPKGYVQDDAIGITAYQNPGGETNLIAIPDGGRWTSIEGYRVVVSRDSNSRGGEILWIEDRTAYSINTTLSWGETLRIFHSMITQAPKARTPEPSALR